MRRGIRQWTVGQFGLVTLAFIVAEFLLLNELSTETTAQAPPTETALLAVAVVWFLVAWIWFGRSRTD